MQLTPEPLANPAAVRAVRAHVEAKSLQTLMGMVTGIVADAQLHDSEVALLSTWLAQNAELAQHWPGSVISEHVRCALADGLVTEDERAHLLRVLSDLSASDFANTGSATAAPVQLPIDDTSPVDWRDALVVHTGTFLYGTRSKCERLTTAMGGLPQSTVNSRTRALVIGTCVTASWITEAFGRKIMQAADLRAQGHPIRIVSERFWLAAAQESGCY